MTEDCLKAIDVCLTYYIKIIQFYLVTCLLFSFLSLFVSLFVCFVFCCISSDLNPKRNSDSFGGPLKSMVLWPETAFTEMVERQPNSQSKQKLF